MIDLKGPYDILNKAREARDQKAAEISALLDEGTDEAIAKALALQESLDTLQADMDQKKALYDKLVNVNAPSDVAKLFVPASTLSALDDETPKVMKRSDFFALSPAEQKKFALNHGVVVD